MRISFVTITAGRHPESIIHQWQSIAAVKDYVEDYEQITVGKLSPILIEEAKSILGDRFIFIPFTEKDDKGWITRKKNIGCAAARFDMLMVLADDCWFPDGFFERLVKVPLDSFDALGFAYRDDEERRPYDWNYYGENGHFAACYDMNNDMYYIDGTAIFIKKKVWDSVKWDESRFLNEQEDNVFTLQVREKGYKVRADGHLLLRVSSQHHGRRVIAHAFKCCCDAWKDYKGAFDNVQSHYSRSKAVLFDVDNVLIDMDSAHFDALNSALMQLGYLPVPWEYHLEHLKGLPTKKKLAVLAAKGYAFIKDDCEQIEEIKQKLTAYAVSKKTRDGEKVVLIKRLKECGYSVVACSNAIRATTIAMLSAVGVIKYCDFIFSNEDVKEPKPSPEMYLKAMTSLSLRPEECLIVEDSEHGKAAAIASGARLCSVRGVDDVTWERIDREIQTAQWMRVVIPLSGAGKRFVEAGYNLPKPLIDIDGKTMIERVVKNVGVNGQYVFIIQKEHDEKYGLGGILDRIKERCFIRTLDGQTEGAACSILEAEDFINNEDELLIANSDQLIDPSATAVFLTEMRKKKADGGIITFTANHPKWSYAKFGPDGLVTEVAEKKLISNEATVGIYYWRNARDFIKYAKQMIKKDIRVNGEFYVCPVYNEAIADGKKIYAYHVDEMHGLGTPEDLKQYLSEIKKG